jgi:rare lipoprotein A
MNGLRAAAIAQLPAAARFPGLLPVAVAALALSACSTLAPPRRRIEPPPPAPVVPPPAPTVGAAPASPYAVPDAVPRFEPRSRYGNPPYYDVFGRRYRVLASASGYVERGVASWYGPGFHAERTSTGEPYDMYAMTAAHKTLPLPAYARVTNLQNGRSVVVRINDRGPFVGNRIIDLSWTAAAKLDMLHNGTAMVEVRVLEPASPSPLLARQVGVAPAAAPLAATPLAASVLTVTPLAAAPLTESTPHPATAPLFVQAGAFADARNADRLAARLRDGGYGTVFVRAGRSTGRTLYRVRIGPVPDVAEFDRVVAALEAAGVDDAQLALD